MTETSNVAPFHNNPLDLTDAEIKRYQFRIVSDLMSLGWPKDAAERSAILWEEALKETRDEL